MALPSRPVLCWVAVLAAGLLPVSTTGAYVLQGGKWPQPDGPGSPVTVTYSFNNLLDGGLFQPDGQPLSPTLIRRSVEEALGVWASVVPLHFVEVLDQGGPVYFGTAYPDGQFGQIRFSHVYINGPDDPSEPPTAKAMAYFPGTGGNLGGDVFLDPSDPWQEVGALHEPDVLGAVIHELGHTLGLGHSTTTQSNMYWIFTRYSGLGTGALYPDDIAGVQRIYGAGVGSVTPLVSEPASGALAVVAGALLVCCRRRSVGRAAI